MVAGQATGYGVYNQTTKTFPRATIYNGPAVFTDGVVSTAADMSKYIVALLNEELLDPSTYSLMWTPAHVPGLQFRGSVSNRGLGWDTVQVNQSGDVTRIGKTGEAFGYMAQLYVYNQAKDGVFVAFNGDGSISAPAVADAVYASTSTAAIKEPSSTARELRWCGRPFISTPTATAALIQANNARSPERQAALPLTMSHRATSR